MMNKRLKALLLGSAALLAAHTNAGGLGVARMWASPNQIESPTAPWNAVDAWGNSLSSQLAVTQTQGLQEFLLYASAAGEPAETLGGGEITLIKQTGTVTAGSTVITNLGTTAGLAQYDFVVGNGVNANYISGTNVQIVSVDSSSQVTMSQPAAGSGTIMLWFSNNSPLNTIHTAATIQFPPMEDWYYQCLACQIVPTSAVTGPTVQIDSFMASRIIHTGVIESTGNTNYNPVLEIAPTNPVPVDNASTQTASRLEFGSIGAGNDTPSNVDFNPTNGSISGAEFEFAELEGNNVNAHNITVQNPGPGFVFSNNIIKSSNVHNAGASNVLEGYSTTNQTAMTGNIWELTVVGNGTHCFDSYGVQETLIMSCPIGASYGYYGESGASAQGTIAGINLGTAVLGNFTGTAAGHLYSGGNIVN